MKNFIKQLFNKRKLKQDLGLSLIELTVVLAITGLIAVPLTQIFRSQLRIPAKIAAEVNASRQIQKSTLILIEDAQAAQSFTPGDDPEYGEFAWVEVAGPQPLPVTSRYFFKEGKAEVGKAVEPGRVFRQLTRGVQETTAIIILEGIEAYDQVVFQIDEPIWAFDSEIGEKGKWTYTEGKITVSIRQVHEAGAEFGEETLEEAIVADFRPQSPRPVALPPSG